jgi:hypothetical protein
VAREQRDLITLIDRLVGPEVTFGPILQGCDVRSLRTNRNTPSRLFTLLPPTTTKTTKTSLPSTNQPINHDADIHHPHHPPVIRPPHQHARPRKSARHHSSAHLFARLLSPVSAQTGCAYQKHRSKTIRRLQRVALPSDPPEIRLEHIQIARIRQHFHLRARQDRLFCARAHQRRRKHY